MFRDHMPSQRRVSLFMIGYTFSVYMIILSVGFSVSQTVAANGKLKGHMQHFGESGTRKEVDVKYEFPSPYDFLVHYVQRLKPLKLPGVAQSSRAVRQWTDDHLLSLNVPQDSVVQLETKKKENRDQEVTEMHFHEFLRIYNHTEHYLVDDVPSYLSPDVMVPCSLQCPELMERGFTFAMMWFSSGGTKSVIHTDSFDNIHCLVRGEKTFVLMDPARDREKIKLKTEGAYSDIDVDSVDLTVYPELADAEFYHVHMHAGDCLYIPYLWIHQVRSFDSNVAVNFWWNHYATTNLLDEKQDSVCQGHCDPDLTLDKVKLSREDAMFADYKSIRDWSENIVLNNPLTVTSSFNKVKLEFGVMDLPELGEKLIIEVFEKLDLNGDGQFTKEEHKQVPEKTWREVQRDLAALSLILAERQEYTVNVEAEHRDEL